MQQAAYREYLPHPALAPFVDRFWTRAEGSNGSGRRIVVLPDGCIDVLVDCARGGDAVVVGTMTRAKRFEPSGPVRLVAARFRPGGAVPFLRVTADALTDCDVPLRELGGAPSVPDGLGEGEDLATATRRLEQALLRGLERVAEPDPRVRCAVGRLFGATSPTVATLAGELGMSRQHFTRTLRAHTGVGAKQLSRIARLQRAVLLLQGGPGGARVADVALRAGYYDQAHMDADFRALIGVPPRLVRTARGSISPIRSLFVGAGSRP